jgi:hypothetical protein
MPPIGRHGVTVFVRPTSAAIALGEAMRAELAKEMVA